MVHFKLACAHLHDKPHFLHLQRSGSGHEQLASGSTVHLVGDAHLHSSGDGMDEIGCVLEPQ